MLRHLRDSGFRRIGMIASHTEMTNFALRLSAFDRGMSALGLTRDPELMLSVDATLEGAYRDVSRQLARAGSIAEA